MKDILVVTGSVRPSSVNEKMVPIVADVVKECGASVTIADLKKLDLPLFNAPVAPSDPRFFPADKRVLRWTSLVAKADGVVLVTPEYNHTMSPVQLNAIDWIYKEWSSKPVALVGYGWRSGASQAHAAAREALAVNLKAKVGDEQTNLFFSRDIDVDGSVLDKASVLSKITASVRELIDTIEDNV